MNNKEKIEKQIEKTLEQFNNAEILPPNPFFYTRVEAKIKAKQKSSYVLTEVLKPAMLIVLLAINISTAVWYLSASEQQEESSQSELIYLLSSDFKSDNSKIDLLNIN
ncbi:MAG: hypothetical protein WC055_13905 [Melioribacteraceae bacterium]